MPCVFQQGVFIPYVFDHPTQIVTAIRGEMTVHRAFAMSTQWAVGLPLFVMGKGDPR